jgi:hypothetical protein
MGNVTITSKVPKIATGYRWATLHKADNCYKRLWLLFLWPEAEDHWQVSRNICYYSKKHLIHHKPGSIQRMNIILLPFLHCY